jgi:HK97 family phage major capsid protein
MNKKIRELRDQKALLADQAQAAIDSGDLKKAKELGKQMKDVNDQIETIEGVEEEKARNAKVADLKDGKEKVAEERATMDAVNEIRKSNEYANAWAKAIRNHATRDDIFAKEEYGPLKAALLTMKDALTEGGGSPAGSEGGFLNPIDFDNTVIELQRQLIDLGPVVNVETVNTNAGWRVVETAKSATGFTAFDESASDDVPTSDEPSFTKVDYSLIDYGGIIPISNDLLADTAYNLMQYIAKWYARKEVLTWNGLIIAVLKALSPGALNKDKGIASIKTALNKTLDPAHSLAAKLLTNQSGFDYLDQLNDLNDRPLLQPNPTDATQYLVKARQVIMMSDANLTNLSGPVKYPLFIGDLKSMLTLFKRGATEIASTNIGGTAWTKNQTQVRAIVRLNLKTVDSAAVTYLTIAE